MKKNFHVFSHIPTLRSGFALGVTLLVTSTAFATTHDLSALTGDLTAEDGDVLTGTLDGESQPYKISIAAGATVTLNDATISGVDENAYKWAGITCLGDCNIILADGSENVVKGFYYNYPGIYVPENSTLTIDGDGLLNASSNEQGAGIGCGQEMSCGNIVINGGTITANAKNSSVGNWGSFAAGIGGAYGANCGNITINGGSVSAHGGSSGAGIGAGYKGSVGTITINGGEVIAESRACAPGIGLGYTMDGDSPICEAIVIGDGAKVTAKGTFYDGSCSNKARRYSIGIAPGEGNPTIGSITIGGVETGYIKTNPFTYPSLVYVSKSMADGKTQAVIDGNFQGDDAIDITEEIAVDNVVFNRAFSTSGYSTLMLPFDYVATNLENVEAIIEFAEMTTNGEGDPAIGMSFVWCSKDVEDALAEEAAKTGDPNNYDQCNTDGTKFPGNMTAYTPYMALMGDAELVFKEGATLATTASAVTEVSHSGWTFKAPLQKKEFTEEDTKNGTIWGFAAKAKKGASIGKFVRFGSGAYVQPFRAYMESSSPLLVSASPNAQFVARPTAGVETASIESIDVVIVSRGDDGEKHTTTIGKFNTRTGEFQMLLDYDLKGRKTNITNRAQGAYYGKKVLKK